MKRREFLKMLGLLFAGIPFLKWFVFKPRPVYAEGTIIKFKPVYNISDPMTLKINDGPIQALHFITGEPIDSEKLNVGAVWVGDDKVSVWDGSKWNDLKGGK